MTDLITVAQADLLVGILSFFFTIAILSYIFGDNPLYRFALHVFIGVSVGYGVLIIIYQVLRPRLIDPLLSGNINVVALAAIPLILFIFLVLKISPKTSGLGNVATAFLVGVGTAIAMGGALTGTLLPQVRGTWLSVLPGAEGGFLNNLVIVIGTVTTLMYFQFWLRGETATGEPRRTAVMRLFATIGQVFLVLTLGTVYGGMILAGLAVLSERLSGLVGWLTSFVQ